MVPRTLRYRDRLQKAVLATFTGTFAFAFSLLRSIEDDSLPDPGVTLVCGAVAISLVLLLIHLNRFTHSLKRVSIADLVSRMGEDVFGSGVTAIRGAAPHPGAAGAQCSGLVDRFREERGGRNFPNDPVMVTE
ncbi:DUF2254 family protein [Streptomyces sp. NPDC058620]|uniref:DUF2254 family protein n=1 Tax=Streptomyces sp. NPDC058620 TaxID=3346560 RepID=UPI003647E863